MASVYFPKSQVRQIQNNQFNLECTDSSTRLRAQKQFRHVYENYFISAINANTDREEMWFESIRKLKMI